MTNKKPKPEPIRVKVNGTEIGGREVVIIAGPCAVESMEQLAETAVSVRNSHAKILRGGAFKPRSSPYSFQGLGEEGLKMLREISNKTGMPVVTEVMDTRQVEISLQICRYAPGRITQYAELPVAERGGNVRQTRIAETGHDGYH